MVGFIGTFYLLYPEVQTIEFGFDQIFESVTPLKHIVDTAHHERKKSQAYKFQTHGEDVFILCFSWVVSITNCSDGLKDPVNGIDIEFLFTIIVEIVHKCPRFPLFLGQV